MTALLVIEHGGLDRRVSISKRADYTPGSSLHIGQKQAYTRLDLLRGMLLRSGNDASVALAESDAGSVERFVAEMNARAQQLGAFNTSFENTHGLTRPGHYSSAYDLALIARTALRLPLFQEIVRSQEQKITELTRNQSRSIRNTNALLYDFPGADGVKTGTTDAAGRCVVASATRDHRQLVAVILKSGNRWGDAAALLNWGFSDWTAIQALAPNQVVTRRPVGRPGNKPRYVGLAAHRGLWIDVPRDGTYSTTAAVPARVRPPLAPNQRVGFVTVEVQGQPPVRVPLYPVKRVRAPHSPRRLWDWLSRL